MMGNWPTNINDGKSVPLPTTGQRRCYDTAGMEIPCAGSGQDGALGLGLAAPEPRFTVTGNTVMDRLSGLVWPRDLNPNDFPVTWNEAFQLVATWNRQRFAGHADWRLPNRRELRSLMHYQTRKPALPPGHPFTNFFIGWYWTATTAVIHPAYAWTIHLEGARMFYGRKDQYQLTVPVRGKSPLLAATGQRRCYNAAGDEIDCQASGQDGELGMGRPWPVPRFSVADKMVRDRLTGLCWCRQGDLARQPVSWAEALQLVDRLNGDSFLDRRDWRLPNINELESLVDCSQHGPALPANHPFHALKDVYWSSTTSYFETDWAWALYLDKGALGVGHKPGRTFYVWPVAGGMDY